MLIDGVMLLWFVLTALSSSGSAIHSLYPPVGVRAAISFVVLAIGVALTLTFGGVH